MRTRGFCLIEALIALMLMTIMLLEFGKLQMQNFQNLEQELITDQVLEQLLSQSYLIRLHPKNFSTLSDAWNTENKKLFMHAKSEIFTEQDRDIVRLQWLSGKFFHWQCQSISVDQFSCLELEVSR